MVRIELERQDFWNIGFQSANGAALQHYVFTASPYFLQTSYLEDKS